MMNNMRFRPFAAGEIKPRGWLKRQLEIQAEGLSGHLDQVWPDIRDSRWIGGSREGWERVPYWLDGFIPLVYLLKRDDLKVRAKRYVDAILERQQPDGWICPCEMEERAPYDMWAHILILKVLTQYGDLSGDARIEGAVERALRCLGDHVGRNTLFNWGLTRWYESLIPIYWLYERKGGEWLMELAHRIEAQGMDARRLFEPYQDAEPRRAWTYGTHVVNLAMCLKQDALVSRMRGGSPDAFALKAHALLKRHHGMAVGHFTGDECSAGLSPVQGSELCSVVEAMYSFEQILAIGGNPHWADEIERLAYNALPATMSPDMWTHQYVQMTNQIRCERLPEEHVVFGTNNEEAHLFGLEPNFGCCTANFSQGWPKFARSAFMRAEEGLACCLIAPTEVSFDYAGARVRVVQETEYPFRDTVRYAVETDRPVEMTLLVRVPAFCAAATVDGERARPGDFFPVRRTWRGGEAVVLQMEFACALSERPEDMRCLWRGPLLYSVAIGEEWERKEYVKDGVERKFPYCDYEIHPKSAWNYGFAGESFEVFERPLGAYPFSPDGAPVEILAQLSPVDWPEAHGVCAPRPVSRARTGEARPVRMIPYGCTNLRMTEMPVAE